MAAGDNLGLKIEISHFPDTLDRVKFDLILGRPQEDHDEGESMELHGDAENELS